MEEVAVLPLITALMDENSNVRSSAASALGKLGDRRAVEPLIAALKDEDNNVHYWVAEALARIGDSRALPELERVMRDDKWEDLLGRKLADFAAGAIKMIKAQMNEVDE